MHYILHFILYTVELHNAYIIANVQTSEGTLCLQFFSRCTKPFTFIKLLTPTKFSSIPCWRSTLLLRPWTLWQTRPLHAGAVAPPATHDGLLGQKADWSSFSLPCCSSDTAMKRKLEVFSPVFFLLTTGCCFVQTWHTVFNLNSALFEFQTAWQLQIVVKLMWLIKNGRWLLQFPFSCP